MCYILVQFWFILLEALEEIGSWRWGSRAVDVFSRDQRLDEGRVPVVTPL